MPAKLIGPDQVDQAAAALRDGRLVAFPTETVYGLGADAGSASAVAGIFAAKGRPTGHPLIVHLADPMELDRYTPEVGAEAGKLAAAFWPGPLTLVVERGERVDPATVGGRDTVGLRVPDHPVALALLEAFGGGVAGPSANRFGSVSPTTAQHVLDDLGSVIDIVLDGGPAPVGVESTIVDLTGRAPVLLRPGGISTVEIESVLGRSIGDDRAGPSRAPGMMASHYAPAVPIELIGDAPDLTGAGRAGDTGRTDDAGLLAAVDRAVAMAADDGRSVGLIAPFGHDLQPSWRLPADPAGYAADLYATLRDADRHDLDRLLIVPPGPGPLLEAVLDRLSKAAAPR